MEIYSNGVKMGSGDGLDFGSAFSVTHNGDIGYVSSATANTTIYTVKKSITSPQLLALNTTPIEVIAAPGSGKAVQVLGAFIAYTYATAAYATNTTLLLVNANGTNEIATDGGSLISDVASNKGYMTIAGGINSIVTNDAVVIEAQTGDPTDGGGTVDVYVTYQIITL